MKIYNNPNRCKLPALLDIMEGIAEKDYKVCKTEVIWAAVRNCKTKEDLFNVIKTSWKYMPNILTLDEWSVYIIELHSDPLKGTTTF